MRLLLVMFAAMALVVMPVEERIRQPRRKSRPEIPSSTPHRRIGETPASSCWTRRSSRRGTLLWNRSGPRDAAATLTVPGRLTISEDQTWHVGAIAGGRVDDVSVRLGDTVRAGQILGRIHSHDVHEARAGYQQATTELERARSRRSLRETAARSCAEASGLEGRLTPGP